MGEIGDNYWVTTMRARTLPPFTTNSLIAYVECTEWYMCATINLGRKTAHKKTPVTLLTYKGDSPGQLLNQTTNVAEQLHFFSIATHVRINVFRQDFQVIYQRLGTFVYNFMST